MKRLFVFLLHILPSIALAQIFGLTAFAQNVAMLTKHAADRDSHTQLLLCKAYKDGRGVPQDYAEAYFWCDLAASGTSENAEREDATRLRIQLAVHLTKDVISQQQARALTWFEMHETMATTKDSSAPTVPKDLSDSSRSFASQYWAQKLTAPSKSVQDDKPLPKNVEATPSGSAGSGGTPDQTVDVVAIRKLAAHDAAQAAKWIKDPAEGDTVSDATAGSLTVKVLQTESVPYTVESGGGISTNCNISGSANTYGYANTVGNTTFGNSTSNSNMRMNCNSYDTTIRWRHVMNTMFVEATDGNAYIIACDRAWRWSKCVPLRAGERFSARFTGKGIEIEGFNAKGKEVSATYRILQSRSSR